MGAIVFVPGASCPTKASRNGPGSPESDNLQSLGQEQHLAPISSSYVIHLKFELARSKLFLLEQTSSQLLNTFYAARDGANRWPRRVLAFDDYNPLLARRARPRQRSLILGLVRPDTFYLCEVRSVSSSGRLGARIHVNDGVLRPDDRFIHDPDCG